MILISVTYVYQNQVKPTRNVISYSVDERLGLAFDFLEM